MIKQRKNLGECEHYYILNEIIKSIDIKLLINDNTCMMYIYDE